MDRLSLIVEVKKRIRGLTGFFVEEDYDAAVDDALEELLWELPTADQFQKRWLKSRVRRHLISYLLDESASKFKYDKIYMQQRFEQYEKLLRKMDEEFYREKNESPEKFNLALPGRITDRFGGVVPPGFKYSAFGVDMTYEDD